MTPEGQPTPLPELPTDVKVDGESDDDYELIDIKERVKNYMSEKDNAEKRIPDDMINDAVRWRLNRNDCQNRGYILDGYPKNYH
jgi:adenylate kinase family enzyme